MGAGGVATCERCYVWLPAIVMTVATNQEECMREMDRVGLLLCLGLREDVGQADIARAFVELAEDPDTLLACSAGCAELTDGTGASLVADALLDVA